MAWWWKPEARVRTPADIVQYIKAIAPQIIIQNPNQPLSAIVDVSYLSGCARTANSTPL